MTTRIFVGGLGEGVTAEDIERAFSSLGSVSRVEIVSRSHGSPFGFMDFEPNSDKSMSRLFANYNGCIWKGGKLKVEKASEHYIDRLKREWTESAEITKNVDVQRETIEKAHLRGPKFMAEEKKQLKIFFPKLRKVKSLSFTGTGRHKYSFQRVNVPPLPIHFCDCEEHIKSHEETKNTCCVSPKEKPGVIDEEELNMMQSVMDKLFAKEASENDTEETKVMEALHPTSKESNVERNSDHQPITEQEMKAVDNDEVDEVDDDNDDVDDENFVMNIGIRGSRATLDSILNGKQKELSAAQHKKRTLEHIDKKKSSKKRQKTETDTDVNNYDSQFENGSGVAESPKVPCGEKIISKPQFPQPEDGSELQPGIAQAKESTATEKSDRVASWVQKSSWRDLVGDSVSSSFSISHVLPAVSLKKPDAMKSCGTQSDGFDRSRSRTTRCRVFSPVPVGVDVVVSGAEPTEQPGGEEAVEKDKQATQKIEDENGKAAEEKSSGGSNIGAVRLDAIGGACSFMRSVDSQQQWLKAKSAMSSYLNKKCLSNASQGKPARHGN